MMPRRVRSAVTTFAVIANAITVIAAVTTGYSGCFDAAAHPFISCSGLVFPFFMLANIFFLVFWIIFQWRGAVIPLAGFAACFPPMREYCPVNIPADPPSDAIQVFSMNVMDFNFSVPEDSIDALHTVVRYLNRSKPDIACFQEVPQNRSKWEMLRETGRHTAEVSNSNGKLIFMTSRFKVIGSELIPYDAGGNMSAAFHLLINGDTVTVVANHFQSYKLSEEERSEVEKIISGSGSRNLRRRENKLITEKLVNATRERAAQVKAVCHYIDSLKAGGRSIIVCGDFNETPISYSHHEMDKRLNDCYTATATGPGFSYEQNGMHFRIDHIFCSSDWVPYRCQVIDRLRASDHYPMRCWLKKSGRR